MIVQRTIPLILLVILVSCASKDHQTGSPVDAKDISAGESTDIPADAVTNWQKFFKPTPESAERDLLAKRLQTWKETSNTNDLIERGRTELALGQLKAAETSFRQALRHDENNLDASLELATIYIKRHETGKAFDFLAAIGRDIGTRDDVSQKFIFRYKYILALGHLAQNDTEKGHEILSDLIATDGTFSPGYCALATSYLEHNKVEIAEFVVRRGMDRAKPSANLYNLMAVIAMRQNQEAAARNWIERSLTLSPSYPPALVNRANLSLRGLEYEAAENDLKKALVGDPTSIDALVGLGLAQKHQGRIQDAKSSLEKAIDISPDSASARYNLAILMIENFKKPHTAARLFHEVTQSAPKSSQLHQMATRYLGQMEQHNDRF